MNVKAELLTENSTHLRLNDVNIEPEKIRATMINEVVPVDSGHDLYGTPDSAYMSTTIPLFRKAGIEVNSIQDRTSASISPMPSRRPNRNLLFQKKALKKVCLIWRMSHPAFIYYDRAKPPYRKIKVSNGIRGYCFDI